MFKKVLEALIISLKQNEKRKNLFFLKCTLFFLIYFCVPFNNSSYNTQKLKYIEIYSQEILFSRHEEIIKKGRREILPMTGTQERARKKVYKLVLRMNKKIIIIKSR
jgi:hypothetical protein